LIEVLRVGVVLILVKKVLRLLEVLGVELVGVVLGKIRVEEGWYRIHGVRRIGIEEWALGLHLHLHLHLLGWG
jgi:hypothetical protein